MNKCTVRVYVSGSMMGYPCGTPGKVIRDGTAYCGRHDPVAQKKRRDKQEVISNAKWKLKQAEWNREKGIKALGELLLKGIIDPTNLPYIEEAREIAIEYGLLT